MTPLQWTIISAILLINVLGIAVMMTIFYHKPDVEQALVRTGVGGAVVATGHGILVLPLLHKVDCVDLSVKAVPAKTGDLVCQDGSKAETQACFFVRINPMQQDILQVARALGCQRASDVEAVRDLFTPKFTDVLVRTARNFTFDAIVADRAAFVEAVLIAIGDDLSGFILEDLAIEHLARR